MLSFSGFYCEFSAATNPRIFIFAGPNGAGKTTFAREYLPNKADRPVFVNADLIAAKFNG